MLGLLKDDTEVHRQLVPSPFPPLRHRHDFLTSDRQLILDSANSKTRSRFRPISKRLSLSSTPSVDMADVSPEFIRHLGSARTSDRWHAVSELGLVIEFGIRCATQRRSMEEQVRLDGLLLSSDAQARFEHFAAQLSRWIWQQVLRNNQLSFQ
jgi:hypothetical protein